MIEEGQVVLFKFPQTDQIPGKYRPALVIRKLPGKYDDWLICMISSQLSQQIADFDEIIQDDDEDFGTSGQKTSSLIRISRLAVVNKTILLGLGHIGLKRLSALRERLSKWIISKGNIST